MHIVICGGGKLGVFLAGAMLRDGHRVAILERDARMATEISGSLDGSVSVICGDGCEVSIQEDAGVQQADVFVAATGQDESNLAACEVAARVFDVPRCIARVNSPKNLRIFRRLGIESISSTALIARMIQEEAMLGSVSAAVNLTSEQVGLLEITVPKMRNHDNAEGMRALDIDFPDGVRLVAVSHPDEVEVVRKETRIHAGDQVVVVADTDLLPAAREVVRAL